MPSPPRNGQGQSRITSRPWALWWGRLISWGWFGSSWDENRESIEMLLMDGLDGEYDFFRRILLLG